jgi:hypothetical protein
VTGFAVSALVAVLSMQAAPVTSVLPHAPATPDMCRATLQSAGVKMSSWSLRPELMSGGVTCEAPEGVTLRRGSSGLRYQPAASVNCAFGLRLMRFEAVIQEEAKAVFHSRVRSIRQLGTYNCRRMAAYPTQVSEHSFANAIDVASFTLQNGRKVVVERDWVPLDRPATTPEARFLRLVSRRLFDEQVFSVVLTPSYNPDHRNHFHLDGAAYFVDGTYPAHAATTTAASSAPAQPSL